MSMKTKDEDNKSSDPALSLVFTRQGTPEHCAHGKLPLTRLATLATLPDFWGPMDPIGVQKSDSPRERAVDAFVSGKQESWEQS
jgi:hypothetical protein